MRSQVFEHEVGLEVQQQIDACCQAFEQAWKAGDVPKLEDFVARLPLPDRTTLLRELLIIEMKYRNDSGPLSDSQICAFHAGLMPEIADELKRLREGNQATHFDPKTRLPPAAGSDNAPTIDHQTPSRGSRGLHIRCPHCSNPVELLTDTPYESITCRTCGSAFSLVDPEEQTLEAPTLKRIGRFELVARLGIGGFGTVWKARDTELDRTVAVKIPRKGQLAHEEIEQFFREARSAAQLRHPNIVPVHEVGRDEDTIFIVSDLVRGVSLADWLSGSTPNCHETAQLIATIADALHHAHLQGVIHRDLKPSNILLDDAGQPHLMDFGLAKREVGEITITIDGHMLGTPAYMSPEQAAGEGHWTDRRTDIYSLGVILFRMLTGELPFRGNAQMQIHQRLNSDPPDPRQFNRHLPRDLCTICLKCLERDPNKRFATAKDVAEECRRFMRREPILSRPISRIERTLRWTKRNPAVATATVLTVFLAIAGPVAALVFQRQQARLQARIVENDHLINRYRSDIQKTTTQIDALQTQLGVWEGKSNPWAFWLWPPKRDEPARRNMVDELFEHSAPRLTKRLLDTNDDAQATAQSYLGLGILADAAAKTADANKYYQSARKELEDLHRENPGEPQITRALADCLTRLARLTHDGDPDEAAKHLENAQALYHQLADEQKSDATSQIDWLEAEMTSALRANPDARARHLQRVVEINRTLADKWPTDAGAIYRLACYLTQTEPILLLPPHAQSPDAKPASSSDASEFPPK